MISLALVEYVYNIFSACGLSLLNVIEHLCLRENLKQKFKIGLYRE